MKTQRCNILLVDDHELFRSGLKLLLHTNLKYRIAYEASNGVQMLSSLKEHGGEIDIVLLDISMPEMDGIEAATQALVLYPNLKIITLSMYGEEDYYLSMVNLGVKGFLLKSSNIKEVFDAIEAVRDNGSYFSEELLRNLFGSLRFKDGAPPKTENKECELSEREHEILLLICKGLTNNEIAEELFISKRTVDKHRANILEKTGCRNTANIVVYAIKMGIVDI